MINRKINNIDVMIDERNAALYIDTQNKVDFKYGNIDEILNFFYNKTYSPLSVYFELTNCCNFNCPFCYINIPKEKKVFLDTKSLLENIDYLTDNGMLFATLSGGECLLHKDFNIIYEYLCKKGILVNILTNGSLIDNEKIKLFKKYKPFKVEISIYGKDNVTYYNNTIQDHIGFENIINNCKKLQDNNINVICKMPINNITFNSFFDVLYFTKKNDIPFYYSDELFNKYSGEDNKQYLIKGSSKVKDFIKNNNLSYMSNLDLNYCGEKKCFDCKAGKYSMIISYDNYIYPCFEFRQIKNARFKIDGNFKQALAKMIEYINLYKNNIISKCDNCLNYSICQDCVINFIKAKTTDTPFLVTTGPFCIFYGIGAILTILCLQQYKGKKIKLFIIGCILMSAIQYALSFILETIVGARLWNYTWSKFNINGRVCLEYAILWGIITVILIEVLKDFVDKIINLMKGKVGTIVDIILTMLIVVLIMFTIWSAKTYATRAKETLAGQNYISNNTNIEIFQNTVFTNEKMEKIFPKLRVNDEYGNTIMIKDIK